MATRLTRGLRACPSKVRCGQPWRSGWSGPHPCPSPPTRTPLTNNVSRFSIYPDGRLVRHDIVNWTESCLHVLGSHQAFKIYGDTKTTLLKDGSLMAFQMPAQYNQVLQEDGPGYGCIEQGGNVIGTTYTIPADQDQWDFFEYHAAPTGQPPGAITTLVLSYYIQEDIEIDANTTYRVNTMTAARGGTCEDLGANVLGPYQQPPSVTGTVWEAEWGAYRAIEDVIQANAAIPSSFTVMRTASSIPTTIVRASDEPGRAVTLQLDVDYRGQLNPGNELLLWFADGLRPGETLDLQ